MRRLYLPALTLGLFLGVIDRAPADEPRVAFVVVLEHAGNADTSAGPVARQLVERMNDLGYFTAAGKSDARGR